VSLWYDFEFIKQALKSRFVFGHDDWSLANAEKGGGEPPETRFLSLLRNVAGA
jgi:hypothetical protein